MKYLRYLVLLLAVVFVLPFVAYAEGEEDAPLIAEDQRVAVYFFHGATCPHCQEAREWFESISEEYGYKYKLVEYEVWNDADNAALMQKVSDSRGDNATGVPYIIIGDKSWIGFSEETMASEILAQIDTEYETAVADRYDVLQAVGEGTTEVEEAKSNDVVALIIILVVVAGVCFGIYKARQANE